MTTALSAGTIRNLHGKVFRAYPVREQAGEDMIQSGKSASSRVDFIASSGIGTELANFIDAFVQSPERYLAMTVEERSKIEERMDAVLSSFRS